jgi:hypothetical protein
VVVIEFALTSDRQQSWMPNIRFNLTPLPGSGRKAERKGTPVSFRAFTRGHDVRYIFQQMTLRGDTAGITNGQFDVCLNSSALLEADGKAIF